MTMLGPRRLCALLLALASQSAVAAVTVQIRAPSSGAVLTSDFTVGASVSSSYELQKVEANIAGTAVQLSSGNSVDWEGTISVGNLPEGTASLVVTATDLFGNAGSAALQVKIVHPPTAVLVYPEVTAVARPALDFIARCADDSPAPCRIRVELKEPSGSSVVLAEDDGVVHGGVCLSRYEGRAVQLVAVAVDSAGAQALSPPATVQVESAPWLEPVVDTGGRGLRDFDERAVVFADARGDLYLARRDGSADPEYVGRQVQSCCFRPHGVPPACVPPQAFIVGTEVVYDTSWNVVVHDDAGNRSIGLMNRCETGPKLPVEPLLGRAGVVGWRDVDQGVGFHSQSWTVTFSGVEPALGPGGEQVWVQFPPDPAVFLRTDSGLRQVTDGGGFNTEPRTDGRNVLVTRDDRWLVLVTPGGERLVPADSSAPSALDDGVVAFAYPGAGGIVRQAWVSPADGGTPRQVTFDNEPAIVEAVGRDESVMFLRSDARWLTLPDGGAQRLGFPAGTVSWNGGWRLKLADTVFRVVPERFDAPRPVCPATEPPPPSCGCTSPGSPEAFALLAVVVGVAVRRMTRRRP